MAKRVKVPGRLESAETGNIVTGADAVMDDERGKTQVVVNNEVEAAILSLAQNKQNVLTFDSTPTEGSINPVTSAGVYTADKALSDAIEAILLLIPSAASALNKLVDMQTMNSSIATATASFKGTYNLVSDLHLGVDATHEQIGAALDALNLGADNNDYAFVLVPNSATAQTEIKKTERYKFNGTNWLFEYDLNNSGFTSEQWNAINSGVTSVLVGKLSDLPTDAELTTLLAGKQDNLTFDNVPTAGSTNPVKSGGVYARNNEIVGLINALDAAKQNVLTFDNAPVEGSTNPVKSGGVYTAISAVQAAIVALDAAKQNVLTFDSTPTLGSPNPVTSSGIKTELNRIDGNITTLNDLYEALTQSALVVGQPSDTWPVASPATSTIYRVVDRVNTPPQNYSDYIWNGSAMVLMATYNNAIDPRPKKASQNLVTSGGVFDNMGALDVSELNATENPHTIAKYVDLSAALAAVPTDYQKGGMSIKFVQSSDNKYVQYRLMSDTFNTTVANWQGVDDEPTAGSDNLVESNGIYCGINKINNIVDFELNSFEQGTVQDGSVAVYPPGSIFLDSGRICSRYNCVKEGELIGYKITNGYRAAFSSWDGNSALITDKSGWKTGIGYFIPQNKIFFVVVSKVNEADLTPNDGSNISLNIDCLKPKVSELENYIGNVPLHFFEQGGTELGDNTGYPAGSLASFTFKVTTRFNSVIAGKTILYNVNSGFEIGFLSWDGNSALITDKSGWRTGEGSWTPQNTILFINIEKTNGQDMTPEEAKNAFSICYEESILGRDEVEQKNITIDCWGDSLTQSANSQNKSYPQILHELSGVKTNNYGDGGETALHIAGRHGGCPAYLMEDVNIPSSEAVVVKLKSTFNNWEFDDDNNFLSQRNSGINPCCIGGVIGNLSYSSSGTVFTRITAGSAITVKAGEFVYPRYGINTTNHIQVIWIGQNVSGSFSTNEELVEIIKNMVQYYNNNKFLAVCYIHRNAGVENVIAAENIFKKYFGMKSFCPREYLNHFGINKAIEHGFIESATSQDIADIADGLIPSSLRADDVHLNYYGYYLVAERIYNLLVQNKIL